MCGIAGILRVHPPGAPPPAPEVAIPEAWLDILDESIKHRGPDGQGRFRDRAVRGDGTVVDVALVHRRLAIIDLKDGHQPMVSPRGRNEGEGLVAVVFNGCIYNHRELRKELQAAGHRFETDHSDTEVLVHGWREWKAELFGRIDGMYAVAVWDRNTGSLTLARDPAGEKPLHIGGRTMDGGPVTFASTDAALLRVEARASRQAPAKDNQLWRGFAQEWLSFGWDRISPLGTDSQVPPGTVETAPNRRGERPLRIARIACVLRPGRRSATSRLNAETLERLIERSVASRLESDVPLACFLSGGLDSAIVAAMAARLGHVRTFTVRMPDAGFDESRIAALTARHIGTEHTALDVSSDPAGDLLALIPQLGLPFGDSSLLPTAALCRAVRASTTVALGGDGGDELFGGYQRYQALALLSRYRVLHRVPARTIPSRRPRGLSHKAHRLIMAMQGREYKDLLAIFPAAMMRELVVDPERCEDPLPVREARIDDALGEDFANYLPHDLMTKSDTASMAVALEVRSPLLSRSLIDACLSEPLASLMPRGERKGLLREVARKYVPPQVLAQTKRGFAVPIGEWFRSDYGGMRQLLRDHLLGSEPFGPDALGFGSLINMEYVMRLLKEHDEAGAASLWPWKGRDHSQRLYMLLVLSIWAKWVGSLR